jgi:DNA-binding NarL/FixJ family response regulator
LRVLLLEDDSIDALAVQRELAGRYDVRAVPTLAEALGELARPGWRPDVIVTDLNLPDSEGAATLQTLQAVAAATPIIVSTGGLTDVLRRQLDALGAAHLHDKGSGLGLLKAVLQQHHLLQQTVASHRSELKAEIDRVARDVADAAADRAIERLVARLGLGDEEGLRMAIRLARGWEAAKLKFFSAIATGIGTALLLALGAGIVAVLRDNASK